ncbi:hypothetical protein MRX96_054574 [Rhipicephalus microplus]
MEFADNGATSLARAQLPSRKRTQHSDVARAVVALAVRAAESSQHANGSGRTHWSHIHAHLLCRKRARTLSEPVTLGNWKACREWERAAPAAGTIHPRRCSGFSSATGVRNAIDSGTGLNGKPRENGKGGRGGCQGREPPLPPFSLFFFFALPQNPTRLSPFLLQSCPPAP